MKTCLIPVLALIMTAVSTSSASEQGTATKPAKSEKAKQQLVTPKQKSPKVALTGSYIKRDIRRSGFITDGANNVAVLDSEMIRKSGATDLSQLLLRSGYRR